MLTIQERNDAAFKRMKERTFEKRENTFINLNQSMAIALSVFKMKEHLTIEEAKRRGAYEPDFLISDEKDLKILIMFMEQKIDYSDFGDATNIIPRYEVINLDGGLNACLRQWAIRFEMGK